MVFVTGGTGFIGGHLVRALLARGATVRCLVRPGSRLTVAGATAVEGDLGDRAFLGRALAGCELLFHCAADYRLHVPDPRSMYRTNVQGTEAILAAAGDAGVRRVVHTSSVATLVRPHGDGGAPATEASVAALGDMIGHYKRSKLLAEGVALAWAARGLPVVIVNPSTPVGDLDTKPTPTGRLVVDFLNRRMPAYVDTGLNLIDVRDVAEGHLLAAERGRPGERYILGHRNMTLREVLEALARIARLPAPGVRLPHWIPLAMAALEAPWARLTGRAPRIPIDGVRMSRHTMYVDGSRAVRELGVPQTAVEEALARAVGWFRAEGYVRP
jgi:dihydroflavonol-4-reductase